MSAPHVTHATPPAPAPEGLGGPPSGTEPAPAPVTNAAFLRAVFGEAMDGAHVTAFRSDPGVGDDRQRWAGNLARRILRTFRPDENTYYVVSLFNQDYVAEATGRATRRKDQFKSMHLVVVDDVGDGQKVKPETILARWPEPSFKLETSPGNEQWGYLFDAPLTERAAAEALVREMIARGLTADGKDPGMAGVTRYVRLPVGTNRKGKYGPDGFRCRMNEWHPERRHSPRELAAAWNIDLDAAVRAAESFAAFRPAAPTRAPAAAWDARWSNVMPVSNHEHAASFGLEDVAWDGNEGNPDEDPLVIGLKMLRLIKERRGPGTFEITCPFVEMHTSRADNGTARMPGGGIACHHGHCVGRQRAEYADRVASMLRRQLPSSRDAQTVARLLKPWKPAPYDASRLTNFGTRFTAWARQENVGDVRDYLRAGALMFAPYVLENKIPRDVFEGMVNTMLNERGMSRAEWLNTWQWALRVHARDAK